MGGERASEPIGTTTLSTAVESRNTTHFELSLVCAMWWLCLKCAVQCSAKCHPAKRASMHLDAYFYPLSVPLFGNELSVSSNGGSIGSCKSFPPRASPTIPPRRSLLFFMTRTPPLTRSHLPISLFFSFVSFCIDPFSHFHSYIHSPLFLAHSFFVTHTPSLAYHHINNVRRRLFYLVPCAYFAARHRL